MTRKKKTSGGGRELAAAYKLLVVQERMKGTPEKDVAAAFGVSTAAVAKWTNAFRRHGPSALESKRSKAGKTGLRPLRPSPVRDKVVELKKDNEQWGTRRIRDVLARFEALGVSEQQVRRILHDEGLITAPPPSVEREHPPRRFERATPNQLWQSDIFTFRLRRAERLYVCVFMDDHSRFIVGHALAHHQKSALVMEAFERGVGAYGQPAEVLTDNGRQYTVWRGKTEFEETVARMGIQHIRSRPQHPQTLGKVERFWKTLWDEFLGRTVFAHVVDAQRRLEHYISHYNFQRPHQGLDGLVPADRFFKAAAHVRAEIERQVQANELRLALEQPPRKPFYVVGQLGDQRLSIAAGAQGLEVHVGDNTQTIPLKENDDATTTARRFAEAETQEPTRPALAEQETGPGRGGPQSRDAGALRALGRETGHDGDRGERDLSRLLLPARDQGHQRDAARAGAGRGWRLESGRDGSASADQGSRGQAGASGTSAASSGAAALRAAQADEHGAGEDAAWTPSEDDNLLDAGWAEKLALLDEDEGDDDQVVAPVEYDEDRGGAGDEAGEPSRLDSHAGWRERGPLMWERKLAGADAASDNQIDGEGQATHVHRVAGAALGTGPASTRGTDLGSDRRNADGLPGRPRSGDVAQSLPDGDAPRDRGTDRSSDAEASGTPGEAGAGSSTRSGEREATSSTGNAAGPLRDDRADDERGQWDRFWEAAATALAKQEDEAGGPGACTDAARRGEDDA
jgi:transposase InsO family protein